MVMYPGHIRQQPQEPVDRANIHLELNFSALTLFPEAVGAEIIQVEVQGYVIHPAIPPHPADPFFSSFDFLVLDILDSFHLQFPLTPRGYSSASRSV
jgi:hypothetical protein